MNHRIRKGQKLNRTSSHRRALFMNMANSIVDHEQIVTTLAKAKAVKSYVEKLITLAKKNNLNSKRILLAKQQDRKVVQKLTTILANRYKDRKGGYTRIIKAGNRYGDMAPMAVIELVDRDITAKGKTLVAAAGQQDIKLQKKDNKDLEAKASSDKK